MQKGKSVFKKDIRRKQGTSSSIYCLALVIAKFNDILGLMLKALQRSVFWESHVNVISFFLPPCFNLFIYKFLISKLHLVSSFTMIKKVYNNGTM